jgi:hypothetical protein
MVPSMHGTRNKETHVSSEKQRNRSRLGRMGSQMLKAKNMSELSQKFHAFCVQKRYTEPGVR